MCLSYIRNENKIFMENFKYFFKNSNCMNHKKWNMIKEDN